MYILVEPPFGGWRPESAPIDTSVSAAVLAALVAGDWVAPLFTASAANSWAPVTATPNRTARPLWTNPQNESVQKGITGWSIVAGNHRAKTDRYDLLPTTPTSPATRAYGAGVPLIAALFVQSSANVYGLQTGLSDGSQDKDAVAALEYLDSTAGEIHITVFA